MQKRDNGSLAQGSSCGGDKNSQILNTFLTSLNIADFADIMSLVSLHRLELLILNTDKT